MTGKEIFQANIMPWLRLFTPIGLALVLFILSSMTDNIKTIQADIKIMSVSQSEQAERIKGNETAIRIYHPR